MDTPGTSTPKNPTPPPPTEAAAPPPTDPTSTSPPTELPPLATAPPNPTPASEAATITEPPASPTPNLSPTSTSPAPATPLIAPPPPAWTPTPDFSTPYPGHPTYAYPHPIPQPPKPPGPPKSTTAATLLNLTGLGLGYAYLRRTLYFIPTLAITAALITTAFLTDAAATPWLWRTVTILWLATTATHAALLARHHLPATSRRPTIAATAAVVALAAGYLGYGIAGDAVHNAGVDAQKTGNCATALDKFDTVTGPFELTLSENIPDAEARTAECADYVTALTAQKSGNHETAINQYTLFLKNYPHSVLRTFAHKNLAETHVNSATDWQLPLTAASAMEFGDTLMMVLREFDDTPAAGRAPKAMADLFEAANGPFTEGDFCGALPTLDYFAGLDPAAIKDVVTAANANRAKALYECGLAQVRAGDATAVTTLETFLSAYPQDPGVPQAKSALVTAKVAQAAGVTLPVAPPIGGNSPGNIPVTFYNDSNTPLTILIAGPTTHELTLPPCAVCPINYEPGVEPCPTFDGRPSVRLDLTPTIYYILTVRQSGIDSYTDSITPLVGYEHTQCIYVERR